jgi:hypothetical protein
VAIVEAAIATPVFLVLLFGVLEFGLAFQDYLSLHNAATSGARQGAIAGADIDADYQILQAIKSKTALPTSRIVRVVIFHADDVNTPVPAACKSGTATAGTGAPNYTGACNVYGPADFALAASSFQNCTSPTLSRFWCPTGRKTAERADRGNGPPDWLGVYIQVRHPWITGFFGSSLPMESPAVVRLEPLSRT